MRITWLGREISVCLLVLGFACEAAFGDPGTPDGSFGSLGRVSTSAREDGAAVAVQTDGKLVIAGTCFVTLSVRSFCAVRYDSSGVLDPTFGSSGKVVTPIRGGPEFAAALAVQRDGKLLLAGSCSRGGGNNDFCALRYNANGTLDNSFGTSGTVVTSVAGVSDTATALVVQPDGKIVLTGYCTGAGFFCALRYNADGVLDASFGSGGKITTQIGTGSNRARAAAIQSDGKLILAGTCVGASSDDFCVLRYDTFGGLDTTFGTGGVLLTPVGPSNEYANALAVQPDNKVVVAGTCYTTGGAKSNFCAVCYNANGTFDATFGTGGAVITAIGSGNDFATGIALQPDGRMVLAGYCGGTVR